MTNLTLHRTGFGPLFDDFLADVMAPRAGRMAWAPMAEAPAMSAITRARMDVLDKGAAFEVKMDLPGVKKDDIQITIEGSRVSVKAEAKLEREEKDGEKLLHSERFAASYARSFELPTEIDDAAVEARFEDGVLTLALPKRAAVSGRSITIK